MTFRLRHRVIEALREAEALGIVYDSCGASKTEANEDNEDNDDDDDDDGEREEDLEEESQSSFSMYKIYQNLSWSG